MSARRTPRPDPRPRARGRDDSARRRAGRGFGFQLDAPPGVHPLSERAFAIAAGVVCVAFAVAALWFVFGPHQLGDYMTETDFYGAYAQGARMVQSGQLDPSRYGVIGPGYEIALALAGFVVRDLFLAAELLSFVSSIAVLVLWFVLLRRRANAMTGFFAVLFIAANAHFLRHAYSAATDAFAIALQAAALFALLAPRGARSGADPSAPASAEVLRGNDAPPSSSAIAPAPSDRRWMLAGILTALAFLTRYNAISLVPASLIAILAGATAAPHRLRAAVLYGGGFLLVVGPWVLYSLSHGGSFAFQLHHNIAYEVFAKARGIPWDDYQRTMQPQFNSLWDVISRDPRAVFSRMLFNSWDHLRLDAIHLLTVPLAIAAFAGIVIGRGDGALQRLWPLWVTGALLFMTLVPVFYSERYSLALLPMYASLAALAFASPQLAFALGSGRVWLKPLLAAAPLTTLILASVKVQARMIDQLPTEVLTVARTLRELRRPGDRVIARKSHIAYHGGVEPLAFPFADSLETLARFTHQHHVRWIYFSWPEAETRPGLWYLLDTTAVVPGLTPRVVTRPHPAVLYEVGEEFGIRPDWLKNDTLMIYHKLRAQLLVDGGNPTYLYNYAVIARSVGKLDDARGALERLLTRVPTDAGALALLGDILLVQNDPARAGRVFDRLLAVDPTNPLGGLGRGWALLLQHRDADAARAWRPLIGVATDYGTLARMAELYASLGDQASEVAARSRIVQLGGGQ